jgi:hypothetical protein
VGGREGADADDRLGPQVADLEHEGDAAQTCEREAGEAGEDLRGGGEDEVDRREFDEAERDLGGRHGGVAEAAEQDAAVGGGEGRDAVDDDVVDEVAAVLGGAVAGVDHAARVARLTGDDVDLVAGSHQRARELVHAGGGGVALGREVVREVSEAHGGASLAEVAGASVVRARWIRGRASSRCRWRIPCRRGTSGR